MISGGNATVFVSNMDAAVRFYTEVLGLKLTNRFGNDWTTVVAGNSLTIGLHPASPKYAAPGTKGSMMVGFEIDRPVNDMLRHLTNNGVRVVDPIQNTAEGNFLHFEDPDGNDLYLWEMDKRAIPETELQATGAKS